MAWDFISVSTVAEVTSGDITLNAPASAAQGDLYVACIVYRSNATFTLPANWNLVATQQSSGDTVSTGGGIASGVMAYIVRGASDPSFTFTRTAGDVARGVVVCYRGNSASPYDTGNAATLAVSGEPALGEITTAEAGELLVAMVAHGDNITLTAFDAATNPSTASGATDTTTDPTNDTWIERYDVGSNLGADSGLTVLDGIKATAGATGAFSADASVNSRSVTIVGAFKLSNALSQTITETATFTEVRDKLLNKWYQSKTEAASFGETLTSIRNKWYQSISETATFNEVRASGKGLKLTEQAVIGETLTGLLNKWHLTISEGASLASVLAKDITGGGEVLNHSISELLRIFDGPATFGGDGITFGGADATFGGYTGGPSYLMGLSKSLEHAMTLGDILDKAISKQYEVITESLQAQDAFDKSLVDTTISKDITEAASLGQTLTGIISKHHDTISSSAGINATLSYLISKLHGYIEETKRAILRPAMGVDDERLYPSTGFMLGEGLSNAISKQYETISEQLQAAQVLQAILSKQYETITEQMQLGDSFDYSFAERLEKNISEAAALADDLVYILNKYYQIISETASINETLSSEISKFYTDKSLSEQSTLNEILLSDISKFYTGESISEQANVGSLLDYLISKYHQSLSHTLSINDELQQSLGGNLVKSISETLRIFDSYVTFGGDPVTFGGDPATFQGGGGLFYELTSTGLTKEITEAASLLSALYNQILTKTEKTISEQAAINEAVEGIISRMYTSISEGMTVGSTLESSIVGFLSESITEGMQIGSTLINLINKYYQDVIEQLGLGEEVTPVISKRYDIITETMTLSEIIARQMSGFLFYDITESLAISETLVNELGKWYQVISSAIGASETLNKNLSKQYEVISEQASLSEELTSVRNRWYQNISEPLSINEILDKISARVHGIISEQAGIGDTVSQNLNRWYQVISESMDIGSTLSNSILTIEVLYKSLSEQLALGEDRYSIITKLYQIISSAASISEALSQSILTIEMLQHSITEELTADQVLLNLISKLHHNVTSAMSVGDAFIQSIYTILNLFETSGQSMTIGDSVSAQVSKWHQQIAHDLGLIEDLSYLPGNWYHDYVLSLAINDVLTSSLFNINAAARYSFKKELINLSLKKELIKTSFVAH